MIMKEDTNKSPASQSESEPPQIAVTVPKLIFPNDDVISGNQTTALIPWEIEIHSLGDPGPPLIEVIDRIEFDINLIGREGYEFTSIESTDLQTKSHSTNIVHVEPARMESFHNATMNGTIRVVPESGDINAVEVAGVLVVVVMEALPIPPPEIVIQNVNIFFKAESALPQDPS